MPGCGQFDRSAVCQQMIYLLAPDLIMRTRGTEREEKDKKIAENTVKIMAWETKTQECDGWNQRSQRCAMPFTDKTMCSVLNVGYKWHFENEEDKCNMGLLCFWTLHIVYDPYCKTKISESGSLSVFKSKGKKTPVELCNTGTAIVSR